MAMLTRAAKIVQELQEYLEDREGLSTNYIANLTWSPYTLSIDIGDVTVYCSETHEELSLEGCKREWVEYLESLRPYMDSPALDTPRP